MLAWLLSLLLCILAYTVSLSLQRGWMMLLGFPLGVWAMLNGKPNTTLMDVMGQGALCVVLLAFTPWGFAQLIPLYLVPYYVMAILRFVSMQSIENYLIRNQDLLVGAKEQGLIQLWRID